MKAQIYEVTRGVGSAVTMTNAFHPSEWRHLEDAFAFAKDENAPDEPENRVIPGLCRMGLETTAHEVYSTRSYTAGLDRSTVEERGRTPQRSGKDWRWRCTPTRTPRSIRGSMVERTKAAFDLCNSGVHAGSDQRPRGRRERGVRTAVKDLRQTVDIDGHRAADARARHAGRTEH